MVAEHSDPKDQVACRVGHGKQKDISRGYILYRVTFVIKALYLRSKPHRSFGQVTLDYTTDIILSCVESIFGRYPVGQGCRNLVLKRKWRPLGFFLKK